MSYQNSTIIVVHIPKAAGTTLRVIIERQYALQDLYKIKADIQGDLQRFRDLSDEKKRACRLVFGHQCFGLHECLPEDRPYTYITLLRDPIERVISYWAYAKTGPSAHYLHRAAQGSLDDFVASGATRTVDNAQVRQLCGDDRFIMEGGKQHPYRDMLIPFGGVTREHLEKAKTNIEEHFAFAGLAERFDESLDVMRRLFAWRIPQYVNQNVSRWKPKQVARWQARIIQKHNELDYELYNWVRERMERRVGR